MNVRTEGTASQLKMVPYTAQQDTNTSEHRHLLCAQKYWDRNSEVSGAKRGHCQKKSAQKTLEESERKILSKI
jgi:hypothetical protein